MQKRIQKEIGNNCLKRIIVAFLAVIMMTTMLHPQMVQAATGTENGIFIESKNNEAPVFEAGKKKNWNFVITNNSGNVLNNVTITPDLGDKNEDWPFKTEKQSYQKSLGTLEKGQQQEVFFEFIQRDDVPTKRYKLKFTISADGQEETAKWFYMNTTAKRYRKTHRIIKTTKIQMMTRIQEKAMEQAVVLTHLTRHRMPAVTVTEKQLTAEEPVEVRMEVQLREMVLFRV